MRSRQRHLQETHSRRSSRTLRGRTITSETAARLDSGSLPPASTHCRFRRLRGVAFQSLLGSRNIHWPPRGVRETREKIDIELDARRIVTHTRLFTADQRVTLSEHRPPRGEGLKRGNPHPEEQRSSTPRRDRAVCGGPEAQEPQGDRTRVAATAAYAARVSSRAVSGRDRRGRAVWTL